MNYYEAVLRVEGRFNIAIRWIISFPNEKDLKVELLYKTVFIELIIKCAHEQILGYLPSWQLAKVCFGVSAVLKISFKKNNDFLSELIFTVEKSQWEVVVSGIWVHAYPWSPTH